MEEPTNGQNCTLARVGEQRYLLPRRPTFTLAFKREFPSSPPQAVWEAFSEPKVRDQWFGAEIFGLDATRNQLRSGDEPARQTLSSTAAPAAATVAPWRSQDWAVGAPLQFVFPGGEDIAYGEGNLAAMTPDAQANGAVLAMEAEGVAAQGVRGVEAQGLPGFRPVKGYMVEFRWGFFILRAEISAGATGGATLVFSTTFEDIQWAAWNAAVWEYRLDNLASLLGQGRVGADFDMAKVMPRFDHYNERFEAKFGTQIKL